MRFCRHLCPWTMRYLLVIINILTEPLIIFQGGDKLILNLNGTSSPSYKNTNLVTIIELKQQTNEPVPVEVPQTDIPCNASPNIKNPFKDDPDSFCNSKITNNEIDEKVSLLLKKYVYYFLYYAYDHVWDV